MDEAENNRALKKLALAVWLLCVLTVLNITIHVFEYLSMGSKPFCDNNTIVTTDMWEDPYDDFFNWPIEKQIEEASVIALTIWETDAGNLKCIVKEFLKTDPEATFYYNVGEEYKPHSKYPKKDTNYGDGEVLFFVGSPASMRYSITYRDGRLTGMGGMPLELLRQKVSKTY